MPRVVLLAVGMFALGFDAYVVAGLLPDIEVSYHIVPSAAGQLVTVFTLCYALAAPVFASWLEGVGSRKILILALVMFTFSNALSAFAPNFPVLLLARAGAGIGAGLFSPLAATTAASLVAESKRGRALGMTLGGMSTGTVVGVPLGLLVGQHFGWRVTLGIVSVLGACSAVGIAMGVLNTPVAKPASLRSRMKLVFNRSVAATVAVTFVTSVASLGLYTYLASVLDAAGRVHNITLYLWTWGIGGIVGSLLVGFIMDLTGHPKRIMGFILGLMVLAMFSLPTSLKSSVLSFIPFLLWGIAGWASQAPQQLTLLQIAPNHGTATIALNSSANYLGSAVGSLLGGIAIMAGASDGQLPYIAGAIVSVAFVGNMVSLMVPRLHRKLQQTA